MEANGRSNQWEIVYSLSPKLKNPKWRHWNNKPVVHYPRHSFVFILLTSFDGYCARFDQTAMCMIVEV